MIKEGGEVWFRGFEVASILGYSNKKQAIQKNVDIEDKKKLSEISGALPDTPAKIQKHSIIINESGLYSLILRSKLPAAKEFKRWVTKEVLPSIRKTGSYTEKRKGSLHKSRAFNIQSEFDLHTKVVHWLRDWGNVLFTCTTGELQDTDEKRITSWQKGYVKGVPDLLIFDKSEHYNGLALEFKSPKGTGTVSEHQAEWMQALDEKGWQCVISHDYDAIIAILSSYLLKAKYVFRLRCNQCKSSFKTDKSLETHQTKYH